MDNFKQVDGPCPSPPDKTDGRKKHSSKRKTNREGSKQDASRRDSVKDDADNEDADENAKDEGDNEEDVNEDANEADEGASRNDVDGNSSKSCTLATTRSESATPGHRRGPWSSTEDNTLMTLVTLHGPYNWVRIAHKLKSRTPKQCRERYHQNLKPSLNRTPITPSEGRRIERMVATMGKCWAEIARQLDGRSDNAVKNWWNGSQNRLMRRKQQHLESANAVRAATAPAGAPAATPTIALDMAPSHELPAVHGYVSHEQRADRNALEYHRCPRVPLLPAPHISGPVPGTLLPFMRINGQGQQLLPWTGNHQPLSPSPHESEQERTESDAGSPSNYTTEPRLELPPLRERPFPSGTPQRLPSLSSLSNATSAAANGIKAIGIKASGIRANGTKSEVKLVAEAITKAKDRVGDPGTSHP
ncbi:hypothetical protein DCS_00804 [Drechmeria coniospora]|uniref:Uncharacterized protein n=1 Tax=Drechmeria coniospora TaxID=98403 RepID=A0A151GRF4_DRECN|nr:hypothetical protein DCS_00804 [Drechmeria coniospora]KYK59670.1 hypothetical protein DCS_00804 [Drechmeria coniospora]